MGSDNIKILAIDNVEDNLIILKKMISSAFPHSETYTAADCPKGIDLAVTGAPDLVLIDIAIPGMDSFETCERLKSDPRTRDIPVVFLTDQSSNKESRIRALEAGTDAFLTKPLDANELTAQVRAMVRIRRANTERKNEKERLASLVEEKTNEQWRTYIATLNLLEDLHLENEARKKNEEALKKSESRFRSLIENAFDGIYLTNGKYFNFVNEKFCEITGYPAAELTSPNFDFSVTLSKQSQQLVKERNEQRSQNKDVPSTYEMIIISKDGKEKDVEVSTVNLGQGKELNVMGIVRNITERKLMESKVIQSERLSALGEMSAGMAHEINQPLITLSLLFDNLLLEAKNTGTVNLEYLNRKSEKIFENITRIRNLIDHVRDFSRSQDDFIAAQFSVNVSIRNALSMISEQFRIRGIDLEVKLDESLPHIKGNIYKFEQVILNLFSNARDAVIEMKNHTGKNFSMQVCINSYHNKENIYLTVEDNGIGIKKENLDKIMQPFFTTKETGQGTGLGLSISYGIISEHGGKIEIKSEPFMGTTVLITLPIKQKREQHHSDK